MYFYEYYILYIFTHFQISTNALYIIILRDVEKEENRL